MMKLISFLRIICCIVFLNTSSPLSADTTQSSDSSIELNKALYWAAHDGNYEKVENLIEQGAKISFSGSYAEGQTPLHTAVGLGNEAFLDLNHPVDKSLVTKRLKVVELLIRKGANVNAKSRLGRTPLHNVKIKEIVDVLIKSGANVNATDNQGNTPLISLTARGNHKWVNNNVAEALIKHGADVNLRSKDDTSALVLAVRTHDQALVELLVENGADINFSKTGKDSALENAVYGKSSEISGYLIHKGAYLTNG